MPYWLADLVEHRRDDDSPAVRVLTDTGSVDSTVSYRELIAAASALATRLDAARGTRPSLRVAVVAGNSVEHVVADIAAMIVGAVEVPVPVAFASDQAHHLMGHADVVLHDTAGGLALAAWGPRSQPQDTPVVEIAAWMQEIDGAHPRPVGPEKVVKIVHTSGTTSMPKGVIIRGTALREQLSGFAERVPANSWSRYLSVVPMSLLIEQVCAIYMTLSSGGTLYLLAPGIPLLGTPGCRPDEVMNHLHTSQATITQCPPSGVEAIYHRVRSRDAVPREDLYREIFGRATVPHVLSGGAPVSDTILSGLAEVGIEVFVGYGLSENASVVALNGPGTNRLGTVGRPLRHVRIRLAEDGELLVRSTSMFEGYEGDLDPTRYEVDAEGWLHTGDLGSVDDDGFLSIRGRKKNVIITSSGRNVSAEHVEAQYKTHPAVRNVAVFGDLMPELVGFVLVDEIHDDMESELRALGNACLSEVERIAVFDIRTATSSLESRYFTVTGRPRRTEILAMLIDRDLAIPQS